MGARSQCGGTKIYPAIEYHRESCEPFTTTPARRLLQSSFCMKGIRLLEGFQTWWDFGRLLSVTMPSVFLANFDPGKNTCARFPGDALPPPASCPFRDVALSTLGPVEESLSVRENDSRRNSAPTRSALSPVKGTTHVGEEVVVVAVADPFSLCPCWSPSRATRCSGASMGWANPWSCWHAMIVLIPIRSFFFALKIRSLFCACTAPK